MPKQHLKRQRNFSKEQLRCWEAMKAEELRLFELTSGTQLSSFAEERVPLVGQFVFCKFEGESSQSPTKVQTRTMFSFFLFSLSP